MIHLMKIGNKLFRFAWCERFWLHGLLFRSGVIKKLGRSFQRNRNTKNQNSTIATFSYAVIEYNR